MKFSVIGAGGVGQVIVRHLAMTGATVKVGDLDQKRLKEVAKAHGEASVSKLDASRLEQLRRFLKGTDIVINSSHPRFNLLIMKQALSLGANYIDLAGNPTPSEQMKLNSKWRRAGLTAVLGMGEDPGLSNILARRLVDSFDRVSEVRVRDGETSTSETYPFVALFAPDVFLEEAASPAHYFEDGTLKTSPPMSGRELYRFPDPIGEVPVYFMDHEEVHTLPQYLPKKPRYVDFKLALTDETASAIKMFHGIGLLDRKPVTVGQVKVSPLRVLLRLLPTPSEIAGKIHGSAGILVEVVGEIGGERYSQKLYVTMTHDEAYKKYHSNATSYLTGTPTAVCARILAENKIEDKGVLVPEMLNAEHFLREAERLDLRIQSEKTKL